MQYRVETVKYSNATVRVHIPELTESEREKRLKEVKIATEMLLREVIKNELNTVGTNNI